MAFALLDLELPVGSLHLASTRTAALITGCDDGYCYRQKGYKGYYWKCADSVIVHFDQKWRTGLVNMRKPCEAKRGEPHTHGPPPRGIITLMAFRWQCALRAVELFDRATPGEVIEEVYEKWLPGEIPLSLTLVSPLVLNWVKKFQDYRKKSETEPSLVNWLKVCGRDAYRTFAYFYRDATCWPRGREERKYISWYPMCYSFPFLLNRALILYSYREICYSWRWGHRVFRRRAT